MKGRKNTLSERTSLTGSGEEIKLELRVVQGPCPTATRAADWPAGAGCCSQQLLHV